jgi:hypothetical protein
MRMLAISLSMRFCSASLDVQLRMSEMKSTRPRIVAMALRSSAGWPPCAFGEPVSDALRLFQDGGGGHI